MIQEIQKWKSHGDILWRFCFKTTGVLEKYLTKIRNTTSVKLSVIAPGQVDSTSLIAAVDLFPSLCAVGGAELPEAYALDGQNASAALVGDQTYERNSKIYWEYGRFNPKISIPKEPGAISPVLALRDGDWKYLTSFDGEQSELYHLKNDPNETVNLAVDHPKLVKELQTDLLRWFASADKSAINEEL